jgi:PPOX class probable F420-dependent enzyme
MHTIVGVDSAAEVSGAGHYSGRMSRKFATADAVSLPELLDFVRSRHRMVLSTFRADGTPQSSPVSGGVDSEGRIVIASYPQRAKAANVRRRGSASVVVLSDDFNGPYVQVDGPGEVIEPPDAVEPLVDYYRAVAGEHPDWDEYRRAMVEQNKCLIRISPQRWGPVATGGFPPP